jgi:hypothetical protein
MAITIRQQPTTPNIVNGNILFHITSTKFEEPQFQYVADVKDVDGLIQRVKQQPNPSGKGVFDISQIISNQFPTTDPVWNISAPTGNKDCAKQIEVIFGEEYGTSPTSSVTLFNGITDTAGQPSLKGKDFYYILNGTIDALDLVNWNWPSSSKFDLEDPDANSTFTHQNGLTEFNENKITDNDYHTISFLVGNEFDNEPNEAQDVYAVVVEQFDASGDLIATDTIINLTLRVQQGQTWANIFENQTESTRLVHFPAGPQNLVAAGIDFSFGVTTTYRLTFIAQLNDGNPNPDGIWGIYDFKIQECSGFDSVRFAWKNEFGVWDYFNFNKAENVETQIERETYKQTFVDYSTASNNVPYDKQRRGTINYLNKINKTHTINSDWLTQDEADKLRELFFSTNVYIQQPDGEYYPIVIQTSQIEEKTNPLNQKVFQYQVDYDYAMGTRTRL